MEYERVLPPKYFEGMEERLAKLELALLRSKVVPPTLQQMQQESKSSKDNNKGTTNSETSLFRKYAEIMTGWGEIISNRDEPLLAAVVNKYSKAVGSCTLKNNEEAELLQAINLSAVNYNFKLKHLISNFSALVNAANNLENSLALEASINPPKFKEYVKDLDRLHQVIDSFKGFGKDTRLLSQKILVLLEAYNLWCTAVSELIQYFTESLKELEQHIRTLEKIKAANLS